MFKNYNLLMLEAKELIGDDCTNVEYIRGMLELICSFISFNPDNCLGEDVIELAKRIGVNKETIEKLY